MIKDIQAWKNWEKEHLKSTPVNLDQNFLILEALLQEARALHIFPLSNPLQDLEIKISLAKAINVSKAA